MKNEITPAPTGNTKTSTKEITTSEITIAGVMLGLIMACYLLFRGTSNLLNGLLVPVFLYGCLSNQGRKAAVSTSIAFLFLTALVNKFQLVFSFFYLFFALCLVVISRKRVHKLVSVALMSGVVMVSFLLAIRLTDYIFLTRIEAFLLSLVQGNYWLYLLILALEGIFVAAGMVFGIGIMKKVISS